ncbi:hypothetical protein [Xanthomonas sp. SS]|uniref:hypothetical protein n=1 Tax=Xanthomonas sp. SS TaxID=2724122 RepID=UPI001C8D75A5|nr:hypothetical protein [Xanthomonas sp. SS]
MKVDEMNPPIFEMSTLLSKAGFFDFLRSLDSEAALDSRDEDRFDSAWMGDFHAIEAQKSKISEEDRSLIDDLREVAFKNSFRALGDPEISARIADDIELIAKSLLLRKDDAWSVQVLWQSYRNRKFPV